MNVKWENIYIDQEEMFSVFIDEKIINDFVNVSGDTNMLHTDKQFSFKKGFPSTVAHGMLLGSFFSKLVGCFFLGDNNFYLSQSIDFKKPVFVGEKIVVKGTIKNKIESIKVLEILTKIINEKGEDVVIGLAKVKYI